jgi:2-oxoacid:acceptor oxidoreductase gamma subunit (pyruvate/2-ketoisovalerate family)
MQALDVTQGLNSDGIIILNTDKSPKDLDLSKKFKVFTCDATAIAVKHGLGAKTAPIVNTTILGALAKATGLVKLESILAAMPEKVSLRLEDNIEAAKEAYNATKNI